MSSFHLAAVVGLSIKIDRNQPRASGEPARFLTITVPLSSTSVTETFGSAMKVMPRFEAADTGSSISVDCLGASFRALARSWVNMPDRRNVDASKFLEPDCESHADEAPPSFVLTGRDWVAAAIPT